MRHPSRTCAATSERTGEALPRPGPSRCPSPTRLACSPGRLLRSAPALMKWGWALHEGGLCAVAQKGRRRKGDDTGARRVVNSHHHVARHRASTRHAGTAVLSPPCCWDARAARRAAPVVPPPCCRPRRTADPGPRRRIHSYSNASESDLDLKGWTLPRRAVPVQQEVQADPPFTTSIYVFKTMLAHSVQKRFNRQPRAERLSSAARTVLHPPERAGR